MRATPAVRSAGVAKRSRTKQTPEEEIEDYDLLYYAEEGEEEEEIDVPLEGELVEAESAAEPMSAGQFADELIGLVDSVFQEFPAAASPEAPAAKDEPR